MGYGTLGGRICGLKNKKSYFIFYQGLQLFVEDIFLSKQ
jgi:hypothetical protein